MGDPRRAPGAAHMVTPGDTISLSAKGGAWRVTRLIGEGGQGAVYELRSEADGELRALKWYNERAATDSQRNAIRRLIQRGRPGAMFLWPEVIVDGADGRFGYTMALRPTTSRSISDLLLGRVDGRPTLALALCVELANAFLLLHAEGLCYRDISFGNVFFDPGSGAVFVCDNDNVGVDGESESGVLGTRRFMAPEIVRGDAGPSAQTDLHSLAVLLFYVTMMHHPLIGRREQEHRGRAGETYLLGTQPLFIFDPDDDANRPNPLTQPAAIARWARYPEPIRALFVQAFTAGLANPSNRVRESVWRSALIRTRDHVVVCPWCGSENLTERGMLASCVDCHRAVDSPVLLHSARGDIVVNDGTVITRHHIDFDFDFATVVGRVLYDPGRRRWGIRNESTEAWTIDVRGRGASRVEPGQTVALVSDARLLIGRTAFRVQSSPP